MKTYQYTSPENTVVAVIDEDGISRMSVLADKLPGGLTILPYTAPVRVVPPFVEMRQFQLALVEANLFDAVEQAAAAIANVKLRKRALVEFRTAKYIYRNRGLALALKNLMNWTNPQLDALFMAAEDET